MPDGADTTIHEWIAALITLLVCAYALILLVRFLRRTRPDLAIGRQVAVGFILRTVAAVGVSLTTLERALRGGDEVGFLANAHSIADSPLGLERPLLVSSQWTDALTSSVHEFVLATQVALLDSPDLVLRIAQIAIAMAGLVLLAVAVYELAGARAAAIAMWLLALEPSSVFFSSILHREPIMFLVGGLVAFGGVMLWKRGEPRWLGLIGLGCLLAVATRPYAGWFLIAAGAAIALHAGLRRERRGSFNGAILVAVVVLLGAVAAPTILEVSTNESLEQRLQRPQDANVADESNLRLERVDFSTRGAIIQNLPRRVSDVLTRPYVWQLDNASQRLGAAGALIAVVVLALLVSELVRARGAIMRRAGPLLYILVALLIAYSLSAGNAGTAFRYRAHILAFGIAAYAALRFWNLRGAAFAVPAREQRYPRLRGLEAQVPES